MASLIGDDVKKEMQKILESLPSPVTLVYFTQVMACPLCREQRQLLEEVASLSENIKLKVYDFVKDGDQSIKYNIERIPATAVIGKKDYGIRFYGLTAGYEFSSLIQAILMVSTGKSGLDPAIEKLLTLIDVPIHLKVMVTLTCPYCPASVHAAHQLAVASDKIRADMIDAGEFPAESTRYNVSGVPKTIINEVHSFGGALPPEAVILEILKAEKPEEYEKIQEALSAASGRRRAKRAEAGRTYEVVIVGGGPAAMSAAIYAARKGLDTVLIADKISGQITFTAQIDNFLGLPGVSGNELLQLFKAHMEMYPISESVGKKVTFVKKEDNKFIAVTEDGKEYSGFSMIYCAGKEYNRLGVPGEEKFIGKSIAFCATCDAPLYKGRKVAVVGGGNSAFTSARDLIDFASEVHLIHRRDEFTADSALVEEVKSAPNVKFHTNMIVLEVLGDEHMTGIRLVSADGRERIDLAVDGMFLEIGLKPNSAPVKNLVRLNEKGEIPVACDASTTVKGFFAAGDVTAIPEKQICIAVGDGAKAALSAHKYLLEMKLTRSKVKAGESWG